ncbi:MAG: hypothetical protein J0H43_04950 [Actinobacteria bacterium]|nr:hypothetical protein [Actinomycetota bacterium]
MTNDLERRVEAAFAAFTDRITINSGDQNPEYPSARELPESLARGRRLRIWATPIAAAAAVVAVAGLTIILTRGEGHGSPSAAGSPSTSSSTQSSARVSASSTTAPAMTTQTVTIASHCGIKFLQFNGRNWQAVNPIPEPPTRPDAQGNVSLTGGTPGTITLVDHDTLRFVVDESKVNSPVKIVVFHPTTKSIPLCA